MCERLCVCDKVVCARDREAAEREEEEDDEERDTESKTRTPHKDVGKKEELSMEHKGSRKTSCICWATLGSWLLAELHVLLASTTKTPRSCKAHLIGHLASLRGKLRGDTTWLQHFCPREGLPKVTNC